jgi:hypothetical protein
MNDLEKSGPKINCMTIPPVVPVKHCRTIPLCGNFSNHISRTFLIHSFDWFKLNDVMQVLGRFHCMDIDICPLLEDDRIIPLYTSFNLNQ